MKLSATHVRTLIALSALMAGSNAYAQFADGKNTVGISIGHIQVSDKSPDLQGRFTPPGAGIEVGNATTLIFDYKRSISDNFDFYLAAGIPPKHDISGRGILASAGVVATVKQFEPTLFLNYNFGSPDAQMRPYVGVGINYTRFIKRVSTAAGNAANGGPTSIDLTDSTGLALQAGVDMKLNKQWSVGVGVATADVKSDLTANTAGIVRTTTINFRPVLFHVGLNYRF